MWTILTRQGAISLLVMNPRYAPKYAAGTFMNIHDTKYKDTETAETMFAYSAHSTNSTIAKIEKTMIGSANALELAAKCHSLAP